MNPLQAFEKAQLDKLSDGRVIPDFRPGDTVKVDIKVKEGNKERLQAFEGVCIARKNRGINSAFRVRKILAGEGVEKLFPLYSPRITIERIRMGIVRRTKLYYLRDRTGKSARIKERRPVSLKAKKAAASVVDSKPVPQKPEVASKTDTSSKDS